MRIPKAEWGLVIRLGYIVRAVEVAEKSSG